MVAVLFALAMLPATAGGGASQAQHAQAATVYRSVEPGESPTSPDYGVSTFVFGEPNTIQRDLGLAEAAQFHWQKSLFKWRQIEGACRGCYDWAEADTVVRDSANAGLRIIARLDFQPAWTGVPETTNGPPPKYQDYFDFVRTFVDRYRPGSPIGEVQAIEIWNEPNISREWGDQAVNQETASDYVRLLAGSYAAAKSADPNVVVITAGLSPTGVTNGHSVDDLEYLQEMYAAGLRGGVNYDVLGVNANSQAPCVGCDLDTLPAFPHPSFYFRRVEQLRELQVDNGDVDHQIWFLEFGWTSDEVNPAYAWFSIGEDQKAQNLVEAFQYAQQHWQPWIGVMSVWTLADPTWRSDREEYWWAITNPDGSVRPAYTDIESARLNGQLP